jgi:hypothetical protein
MVRIRVVSIYFRSRNARGVIVDEISYGPKFQEIIETGHVKWIRSWWGDGSCS